MSKEKLDALEAQQRRAEMEYVRNSGKADSLKAELVEIMTTLKTLGLSSVAEAQERIESLRARSDEYIEKAYTVLDKVQDK